ncbi:MAG: DUF481 domain-containing protein [Elusimicrobia bacterium]|nr:DUF481 domain-containing protein [Elusimicrobiota bacterium]
MDHDRRVELVQLDHGALPDRASGRFPQHQKQGRTYRRTVLRGRKAPCKIHDRNYAFEKFQWERNTFAGFDHRYDVSGGLGREFWKTDTDSLLAELGGGYQRTTGEDRGTHQVRLGPGLREASGSCRRRRISVRTPNTSTTSRKAGTTGSTRKRR